MSDRNSHRNSAGDGERAWRVIEDAVERLTTVSRSDLSPHEFYTTWLETVIRVLGADGGCLWSSDVSATTATLILERSFPSPLRDIQVPANAERIRSSLIRDKIGLTPVFLNDQTGPTELSSARGSLLLCPLGRSETEFLVAELLFGSSATDSALEGTARVLELFREVAREFQRRLEQISLRQRSVQASEFEQLLARIHGRLEPLETAFAIANDGRHWLAADRVSVVELRHRKARALAISGVDQIDRRSQDAIQLEKLSAVVGRNQAVVAWISGQEMELAPQIDEAVQSYVDSAHVRALYAVPLLHRFSDQSASDPPETVGVLVVEVRGSPVDSTRFRERALQLARHGQAALGCALEHSRLPLRSLQVRGSRLLRAMHRRWLAVMVVVLGLVAVGVVLTAVSADFTIEAQGTLEPTVRRNLFAPGDGTVERVMVPQGERVELGAELLLLRNDRLNLESSRLQGELQTLEARLATSRSKRASRNLSADSPGEERQLAADEEQTQQQIRGLRTQLELLATQRDELRITSPIAGLVLTWNANDLLQDRPVRQGQLLLTIADPTGPWVLELLVPDSAMGHLLAARQPGNAELPVAFLLATDSARTYQATVDQVALATIAVEGGFPAARVTARLASMELSGLRPGAGVIARIHCGRRSLGYVWLHGLLDAVRTKLLF